LRPSANPDHSFQLDSSGSGFGCSGFYRVVESGADHCRVRNFRSLHELFHVYVDEENVLRVDRKISFAGLTILRLHYRMSLAPAADGAADIPINQRRATSLKAVSAIF